MNDLKFSAIVVTYNEGKHLGECLSALTFCSDIIVIDLGSTDDCIQVAKNFGARVISHEWVPMVELIREYACKEACHDWVIFMDPDMVFPSHLENRVKSEIHSDSTLGMIEISYRNYFLGKPIYHGVWGKNKFYPAIIHKDRVEFQSTVHSEILIRPGWRTIQISPDNDTDFIQHYWIDTWHQFVEKHRRYLTLEGESRYLQGMRYSWWKCLFYTSFESFNYLIRKAGYRDGLAGIFLGLLWTWYNWQAWLSLKKYQKGTITSQETEQDE